MDTSKSFSLRGIVIASKSDEKIGKILDIYTVEKGRIKAYLKSAYDLRNNTARSSFVFTESIFTVSPYKEIYIINDSKVIYAPELLDGDIKKMQSFAFLSELLMITLNTTECEEQIYKMLITLLNTMDIYPEKAKLFILAFILKLLCFLGYFPSIDKHNDIDTYKFIYADGKITPDINKLYRNSLNTNELKMIDLLLHIKFIELSKIEFEDDNIKNLRELFINYILYVFDKKEFKTLKVKYWGGENVFSRFNDEFTKLLEG